tara:strand:- start:438 stop:707 length:270 start_codon:yes stop_codon:yes gene_type:complete
MYGLDLPPDNTGDQMIDKWEKEIRSGIVPDLMEDLPKDEAEKILDWSRKAYKKRTGGSMVTSPPEGSIGDRIKELDDLLGSDDNFKEEY